MAERMLNSLELQDVRSAVACGYQEDIDGDWSVVFGQAVIRRFCEVNGLEVADGVEACAVQPLSPPDADGSATKEKQHGN